MKTRDLLCHFIGCIADKRTYASRVYSFVRKIFF